MADGPEIWKGTERAMLRSRSSWLNAAWAEAGRLTGFLGVGALGNAGSYFCYLALLQVFDYPAAFTLAFVAGILFTLWANGRFVFGVQVTARLAVTYATFYMLSYLASLGLLAATVEIAAVPSWLAPVPVAAIMAVVNFIGVRAMMRRSSGGNGA